MDYSQYGPGDFANHEFDILGLKDDGSILSVTSNIGSVTTDGNDIFWMGSSAEILGARIRP